MGAQFGRPTVSGASGGGGLLHDPASVLAASCKSLNPDRGRSGQMGLSLSRKWAFARFTASLSFSDVPINLLKKAENQVFASQMLLSTRKPA